MTRRELDLSGLDDWITREPDFDIGQAVEIIRSRQNDIQRRSELIGLYVDLLSTVVIENAKIFEEGVRDVIAIHNETVPATVVVRPTAFPSLLADLVDDFLRGLNDLCSDTQGDIERALDND